MTFQWANPYSTIRIPVFARNIVSTSQPLASQAGLKIIQQGGNAVDAAIATAAVLMIVEPVSNGLGSDMFAIVWDGEKLHGLNASGVAPAAWSPEYYEKKYGLGANGLANRPMRGWGYRFRTWCYSRLGSVTQKIREIKLFGNLGSRHTNCAPRICGHTHCCS